MAYDPLPFDDLPPTQVDSPPQSGIQVQSGGNFHRVLYTRGDQLLTAPQYRAASFDLALERSLTRQTNVSDDALRRAYSVSATAYACTEYRANALASIALKATLAGQDAESVYLNYFLAVQQAKTLYLSETSYCVWGRTYLRKRYNARGFPTGLLWVNPVDVVYEHLDDERNIIGWRIRKPVGYDDVRLAQMVYSEAFDPDPDGRGLSRLEIAWRTLNVGVGIETFKAAFFLNAARPDGVLTFDQPLSDEQFDEAEAEWKRFKGASNAHRTAVMPGGARWTPVTPPPIDLAMSELKADERAEICAIFQVNPSLVGLKDTSDPLSANSTYSAMEVSYIRNQALPRLRLTVLPALNEQWAARDFDQPYLLVADEPRIPALAEANLARSETANSVFTSGLYSRNEARELVGAPPDEVDVIVIGGAAVPRDALLTAAQANLAQLQAPPASPFGSFSVSTTPAAPPPEPPPPQQTPLALPAPAVPRAEQSLCVALNLSNQPDLVALQRRLQDYYRDVQVDWNAPADFHVTLVYMPMAQVEQVEQFTRALENVDVPALTLGIGSLRSFDSLGQYALHFRIRRNEALAAFQQQIYALAETHGIPVSAFSHPGAFIPHITMGYASERPQPIIYSGRINVKPSGVICWCDDDVLYESAASPTSAPERSAPADMELSIAFPEHALIRATRRTLSGLLTDQGITETEWVDESDWRLPLATLPADAAAKLIRSAEFEQVRRLDLVGSGYVQQGNLLYLSVSGLALDGLRASLDLDGATPVYVPGIVLCRLTEGVTVPDIAGDAYPLVGTNLTLRWGTQQRFQWTLRSFAPHQAKELKNWELVARRSQPKGVAFRAEALAMTDVETWVRAALEADAAPDDVFAVADALLKGELLWRAFPETREAFIREMISLFGKGQQSEINRRNLAARMRANLRRFGLQALRDGMNQVGYDPESFSPKELAVFRQWQDDVSGYVTNFGAEVFGQGISEGEVEIRARMWADVSLNEIRLRGVALGKPMQRMRWRLGVGEIDHCDDCPRLAGQVHTIQEWLDAGILPGNGRTKCRQGCLCSLEPTDDELSGSLDFLRSVCEHEGE